MNIENELNNLKYKIIRSKEVSLEFKKEIEKNIDSIKEQLILSGVVGQSEQLLAYTKFLGDELHLNLSDTWVESYVKNSK